MTTEPKARTRRPRRKPQDAPGPTPDTDEAASYPVDGEYVDEMPVPRGNGPIAPGKANVSEPSSELAVVQPQTGFDPGTAALAMLSDDEFSARLAMLKKGRERIATIQRELLVVDVDYGIIPGTDDRHTLFKAGAEKLCQFYGLVSRIDVVYQPGDNVTVPAVRYDATCYIHLGSTEGPIVATGYGTANSWEKRYLRPSTPCPLCGAPALMKSKFGPGMYCNPKAGGCGSNVPTEAVPASDPKGVVTTAHDLGNTLAKMAEKRAHVDATLRATATSGLFTQDVVEDENSETQLDETTTVTQGGATVDADGVVTGRTDVTSGVNGFDESTHGPSGNDEGPEPQEPLHPAMGPDSNTAQNIEEAGEAVAAVDAERAAKLNELAAAGTAVDPATGKIDADAIAKDPDAPEFTPSGVEGVGRGGTTSNANSVQIAEVQRLSKEHHLGPHGLADEMASALGGPLDSTQLPEDKREAATMVMAELNKMKATNIGQLIKHLRELPPQ